MPLAKPTSKTRARKAVPRVLTLFAGIGVWYRFHTFLSERFALEIVGDALFDGKRGGKAELLFGERHIALCMLLIAARYRIIEIFGFSRRPHDRIQYRDKLVERRRGSRAAVYDHAPLRLKREQVRGDDVFYIDIIPLLLSVFEKPRIFRPHLLSELMDHACPPPLVRLTGAVHVAVAESHYSDVRMSLREYARTFLKLLFRASVRRQRN